MNLTKIATPENRNRLSKVQLFNLLQRKIWNAQIAYELPSTNDRGGWFIYVPDVDEPRYVGRNWQAAKEYIDSLPDSEQYTQRSTAITSVPIKNKKSPLHSPIIRHLAVLFGGLL